MYDEENAISREFDFLYHYGIKGMKWGVRRYQNKDGTLTEAGKRRAAKLSKSYENLTGNKLSSNQSSNNKTKVVATVSNGKATIKTNSGRSISEMTDDELREYTNRINLESNYRTAVNNYNSKNKGVGKTVVDLLGDVAVNSIKQGATNVGKDIVQFYAGSLVNKISGESIVNVKNKSEKKNGD